MADHSIRRTRSASYLSVSSNRAAPSIWPSWKRDITSALGGRIFSLNQEVTCLVVHSSTFLGRGGDGGIRKPASDPALFLASFNIDPRSGLGPTEDEYGKADLGGNPPFEVDGSVTPSPHIVCASGDAFGDVLLPENRCGTDERLVVFELSASVAVTQPLVTDSRGCVLKTAVDLLSGSLRALCVTEEVGFGIDEVDGGRGDDLCGALGGVEAP